MMQKLISLDFQEIKATQTEMRELENDAKIERNRVSIIDD